MKAKDASVRVNLVDRPEWDEYDTAGALQDVIFNAAAQTLDGMDEEYIAGLASDVLSIGRKQKVYLDDIESKALFQAFEGRYKELQEFWFTIQDAASWAWERAMVPDREDVAEAVREAFRTFSIDNSSILYDYELLTEVADYLGYGPAGFSERLIESYVRFEQKEGAYDRYLYFGLSPHGFGKALLTKPITAETRGTLEWRPALDVPKDVLESEMRWYFEEIKEPFIKHVFRELSRQMEGVSAENRFKFSAQWREILGNDPGRVRTIKKELKDFLSKVGTQNA